tara:strand:- start:46 stop:600 length:555 start_codon:yes stop_codon:yes gene_type:complete
MNLRLSPYVSSSVHYLYNVPQKWVNDIKHLEFNEILSSSIGILAMIYSWNKSKKEEFIEIASGTLSSSFVYGDPLTAIGSIAALANGYDKVKNKNELRKYKWSAIRGLAGVGAFAVSTKLISIPILNFLIGIIAASIVKKVVKNLRLFEYLKYLRGLRTYLPYIKPRISRREFLKLDIFKFKQA